MIYFDFVVWLDYSSKQVFIKLFLSRYKEFQYIKTYKMQPVKS